MEADGHTALQRRGDYLGKTVQVIPHVTDAVQDWIERVAKIPVDASEQEADVCIIEVRMLIRIGWPLFDPSLITARRDCR